MIGPLPRVGCESSFFSTVAHTPPASKRSQVNIKKRGPLIWTNNSKLLCCLRRCQESYATVEQCHTVVPRRASRHGTREVRRRSYYSSKSLLFAGKFLPCNCSTLSYRRQRGQVLTVAQASNSSQSDLYSLLGSVMEQLLKQQSNQGSGPTGASVTVQNLSYHPAGSPSSIVSGVSLHLPPNKLGVVFGRSGSGKTTLLALLAGLLEQTGGTISIGIPHTGTPVPPVTTSQQRQQSVGLVFQFPERHFVGNTIAQELSLTWPRHMAATMELQAVAGQVLQAVGLLHIPLDTPLTQLSDGYKRRVALSVALCRRPRVLLLDEPLAGLDWQARADVTQLLGSLKSECSILVVSHDLNELEPLVDCSWRMLSGGSLERAEWPVQARV